MAITGFCITDNPIRKGQPFVEAILQTRNYVEEILVVDLESSDGTRDILYDLGVRVLTASPNPKAAFTLNKKAKCENIIFFEAYEVCSYAIMMPIPKLGT